MRPSPNPKKLKKAAKKLRENKKAPEGAKTALKAENPAVVKTPSPPDFEVERGAKGMVGLLRAS